MVEKTPATTDPAEEKQPSLKEIFADKKLGRDFNVWLEGQDKTELAGKLVTGKLETADLDVLATEREKFVQRRKEADELKAGLGAQEVLSGFAQKFPEIRRIVELVGEDGVREVMLEVIDKMALAPDDDHESAYDSYNKWLATAEKLTVAQEEMKTMLADSELTADEAEALIAVDNAEERKEQIKKLLTKKGKGPAEEKGFWLWKRMDWSEEQQALINMNAAKFSDTAMAPGGKSGAEKMGQIKNLRTSLETKERDVLAQLRHCLSEKGVEEIGRVINGEKKAEEKGSFQDLKKEVAGESDKDKTMEEFFAYAGEGFAEYINESGLPLGSIEEKDVAVDAFFDRFKADKLDSILRNKKAEGFWVHIYGVVIEPFLDDLLGEMKEKDLIKINADNSIAKKKKPK